MGTSNFPCRKYRIEPIYQLQQTRNEILTNRGDITTPFTRICIFDENIAIIERNLASWECSGESKLKHHHKDGDSASYTLPVDELLGRDGSAIEDPILHIQSRTGEVPVPTSKKRDVICKLTAYWYCLRDISHPATVHLGSMAVRTVSPPSLHLTCVIKLIPKPPEGYFRILLIGRVKIAKNPNDHDDDRKSTLLLLPFYKKRLISLVSNQSLYWKNEYLMWPQGFFFCSVIWAHHVISGLPVTTIWHLLLHPTSPRRVILLSVPRITICCVYRIIRLHNIHNTRHLLSDRS